jgi:phosphotransferase system  glucose/maltose/N-acetylglucosamine-specific IIC component
MSTNEVNILNTKLDILIEDFKSFKQYSIGFVMAILIPFGVYVVIQITDLKTDVAVEKTKLTYSNYAIKEEN